MTKSSERSWLIFAGVVVFLFSFGLPIISYLERFNSPVVSKDFNDWTAFSNYFNGISTPLIAFFNLVLFVYISLKVSSLQQNFTVHQMRNEAYNNLLTNFNFFSTGYAGEKLPDRKLFLIESFQNQINLYPERMTHLFSFEKSDANIQDLKTAIATLKINMEEIQAVNSQSAVDKDETLYQQVINKANIFFANMQAKVLAI